jgi:hypothetical protein
MAVVVQLEGVKTSLDVIPDGTYPANLTKRTFGMSKAKQPKVSLEFVFSSEAGEDIAGRKAFVEASLQPQALFKVKKILIDLGMDPDDLEGPVDLEAAFDDLMGAETTIKVGHHEYNNAEHNDFYVISPDSWSG